jgi:hypothetical protein
LEARELLQQEIAISDMIGSSTADELQMLSMSLEYIFGRPRNFFQVPIDRWLPGCDMDRVSRLLEYAGLYNRITIDHDWVCIAVLPSMAVKKNARLLRTVSAVACSGTGLRLCAQLMKTQQMNDIFRNSFYSEYAMLAAILKGATTLPFYVSPSTPGLLQLDFRVNFVRVAWLVEARGYSVSYEAGVKECFVAAPGVFSACHTWTGQRSLLRNMGLCYAESLME